jgi:NTP pyrophosphatase (non-canonical NTP hydrolase)
MDLLRVMNGVCKGLDSYASYRSNCSQAEHLQKLQEEVLECTEAAQKFINAADTGNIPLQVRTRMELCQELGDVIASVAALLGTKDSTMIFRSMFNKWIRPHKGKTPLISTSDIGLRVKTIKIWDDNSGVVVFFEDRKSHLTFRYTAAVDWENGVFKGLFDHELRACPLGAAELDNSKLRGCDIPPVCAAAIQGMRLMFINEMVLGAIPPQRWAAEVKVKEDM